MNLFINNIIYRPAELEHISCYEMVSMYELKKMDKKKIEKTDYIVEGRTIFNVLEEHPSHRHMIVSKRIHPCIPCISSINLLPSVADLSFTDETHNDHTVNLREN